MLFKFYLLFSFNFHIELIFHVLTLFSSLCFTPTINFIDFFTALFLMCFQTTTVFFPIPSANNDLTRWFFLEAKIPIHSIYFHILLLTLLKSCHYGEHFLFQYTLMNLTF